MRPMLLKCSILVGVLLATAVGSAQSPATQQKPEPPTMPLKVAVVIIRHTSDKAQAVLSRIPFELFVNPGIASTVRYSSEVPVPTTTMSKDEATNKTTPVVSYSYRSIGTSLTVEARALGDGRFALSISIDDSQMIPTPAGAGDGVPRASHQGFRTQTTVILRDAETVQHSLATDRVTGDVTKVTVSLDVLK